MTSTEPAADKPASKARHVKRRWPESTRARLAVAVLVVMAVVAVTATLVTDPGGTGDDETSGRSGLGRTAADAAADLPGTAGGEGSSSGADGAGGAGEGTGAVVLGSAGAGAVAGTTGVPTTTTTTTTAPGAGGVPGAPGGAPGAGGGLPGSTPGGPGGAGGGPSGPYVCDGCAPLTGLPGGAPDRAALAVKIDNHDCCARPRHAGLNQADIVFEERIEQDLTRFIAIYHSQDAVPVGPIRSARTTDVYILPMFNTPLLAYSGGNDGVLAAVAGADLVDVGQNRVGQAAYNDESTTSASDTFATTPALWGFAGGAGGRPGPIFAYRGPGEPILNPHQPVNKLRTNLPTPVEFEWDGGGWLRYQTEGVHSDTSGPIKPENVVVLFTQYGISSADFDSPETTLTSGGEAWVFTSGMLIRGSWSRAGTQSPPVLLDSNGQQIKLTPGQTFVELLRPGSASLE